MTGKSLNVRDIDPELLEKFKQVCFRKSITIRQAVINLLALSVKRDIVPPTE